MMNIVYIAMGVAGVFVFLMLTLIVLCFMLIRKLNQSSCSEPIAHETAPSLPAVTSVPEKRKSRLAHLLPKNE
jgi:hypothetical protein